MEENIASVIDMSSGPRPSKGGVEEKLEVVCVAVMLVVDDILRLEERVSSLMSDGYLLMSKARYSMSGGHRSVGELQYDASGNMTSSVYLATHTAGGDCHGDLLLAGDADVEGITNTLAKYVHISDEHCDTDSEILADCVRRGLKNTRRMKSTLAEHTIFQLRGKGGSDSQTEDLGKEIRRRAAGQRDALRDEDTPQATGNTGEGNAPGAGARPKGSDPLHWFGILVPNSLKQCQQRFKDTIPIIVEIATCKSKLAALLDTYKKLASTLPTAKTANEKHQ